MSRGFIFIHLKITCVEQRRNINIKLCQRMPQPASLQIVKQKKTLCKSSIGLVLYQNIFRDAETFYLDWE